VSVVALDRLDDLDLLVIDHVNNDVILPQVSDQTSQRVHLKRLWYRFLLDQVELMGCILAPVDPYRLRASALFDLLDE